MDLPGVGEQGWDATLPEVAGPAEVWEHVTFGREWHLGRAITKVGPYDGHLTNAAAYARPGLEDVVHVSSDAL